MVQKWNKDIPTVLSMKKQIHWYIRYFDSSLPSLLSKVIKTLHKIIYVACVFLTLMAFVTSQVFVSEHSTG